MANALPKPVQLVRGIATIPLVGIDVPFHSTHLQAGIPTYRRFLQDRVKKQDVKVERLLGKWIPNVTAKPFNLEVQFLRDLAEQTNTDSFLRSELEMRSDEATAKIVV